MTQHLVEHLSLGFHCTFEVRGVTTYGEYTGKSVTFVSNTQTGLKGNLLIHQYCAFLQLYFFHTYFMQITIKTHHCQSKITPSANPILILNHQIKLVKYYHFYIQWYKNPKFLKAKAIRVWWSFEEAQHWNFPFQLFLFVLKQSKQQKGEEHCCRCNS